VKQFIAWNLLLIMRLLLENVWVSRCLITLMLVLKRQGGKLNMSMILRAMELDPERLSKVMIML